MISLCLNREVVLRGISAIHIHVHYTVLRQLFVCNTPLPADSNDHQTRGRGDLGGRWGGGPGREGGGSPGGEVDGGHTMMEQWMIVMICLSI